MSFDVLKVSVENVRIKDPAAKLVLYSLANALNHGNGECHPSISRIVRESGLSRSTVIRKIKKLESEKWISVKRVTSLEKGKEANRYVLNIEHNIEGLPVIEASAVQYPKHDTSPSVKIEQPSYQGDTKRQDETREQGDTSPSVMVTLVYKEEYKEDKKQTPNGVCKKENFSEDEVAGEDLSVGNPAGETSAVENTECRGVMIALPTGEVGDAGEKKSSSDDGFQLVAVGSVEAKKPRKSTKGCRLPDDWKPDISEAMRIGLTEEEALFEADRFRDYWQARSGQAGVRSDWLAVWRNWARGEVKRSQEREKSRRYYAEMNTKARSQRKEVDPYEQLYATLR